jgi:uncharacterized tellurite resistance protein B-like protein
MQFSELLNLFKSGKTTVKSHMKNLIEMAAADGHFQDVEYDLLKKIGKRNGVSEKQLQEIRSNPTAVAFEVPKDNKEIFHQIYDLVHMMSIDEQIHSEERKLCNLIAIKFGYKRGIVDDLIDSIRSNIKNGISHDEALKRLGMLIQN